MGKKNNSYTASYKSKLISFAEQFGNRAAQREFGILESNVRYWRKQKELLKNAKSIKYSQCTFYINFSTYDVAYAQFHQDLELPKDGAPAAPKHVAGTLIF
jgi:hypothetical protein